MSKAPVVRSIDLLQGPRAQAYAFYRHARQPRWGLTTRLEVGALLQAVSAMKPQMAALSPLLAYHHALLRALDAVPALRQRLSNDGGAVEWTQVDASITLAREDGSFAVAYLPYARQLPSFIPSARAAMDQARTPGTDWGIGRPHGGCVYTTTLPWLDFTHFQHAHTAAVDDATPRIAFGQFCAHGGRVEMAMNVEVHHALVDGLHVGQFVQAFQALLNQPDTWLSNASDPDEPTGPAGSVSI
ncbi:CatA-like O-acetyltransferase [Inhella gelatinilytica]|uniref:Chloramphenicol acetyltransferase n=1 Tax=Inhella gelatinilytica TaxID=2795030 RepID=A0A931NB59_9BURK|nr:CatA-like O-acetyltransferase [Inhella gelatinilytica]MBH9553218.1 hypothetical protein [Inhella gelatinilytica]